MQNKKIIISISTIATVLVIAGIFIYSRYNDREAGYKPGESPASTADMPAATEEDKIDRIINMADKQYPSDYKRMKAAIIENDAEHCSKLEDYGHDECIYDIASANENYYLCDRISDNTLKDKCLELSDYRKSLAQLDIDICLGIMNKELGDQCMSEILKYNEELDDCAEFEDGEVRQKCSDLTNTRLAINDNSEKYCEAIIDTEIKENCQSVFSATLGDSDDDGIYDDIEIGYGTNAFKADTDDDGLDDLEELQVYQTDPVNPDTDGDGYTDGEEVKNGFDPLGA